MEGQQRKRRWDAMSPSQAPPQLIPIPVPIPPPPSLPSSLQTVFEREIDINDSRHRMNLTKKSFHQLVEDKTLAIVSVRGRYCMQGELPSAGEKRLHLWIRSSNQESTDKAAKMIEETILSGLFPSIDELNHHTHIEKIYVELDTSDPRFPWKEKIAGPQFSFLKHISNETKCYIFLRGRGSMIVGPSAEENNDRLHLLLKCNSAASLEAAKSLVNNLLRTVSEEYHRFVAAFPVGIPPMVHPPIPGLPFIPPIPFIPLPPMVPIPPPFGLPSAPLTALAPATKPLVADYGSDSGDDAKGEKPDKTSHVDGLKEEKTRKKKKKPVEEKTEVIETIAIHSSSKEDDERKSVNDDKKETPASPELPVRSDEEMAALLGFKPVRRLQIAKTDEDD